jgi:hypothetical protein
LYEYQKKRVTEKAFRKLLILKDAILVALGWQMPKQPPGKRKTGASSRGPNAVSYTNKYIRK